MPSGGEITLLARAEPQGVVLDVIDTGQGMPPEQLAAAVNNACDQYGPAP